MVGQVHYVYHCGPCQNGNIPLVYMQAEKAHAIALIQSTKHDSTRFYLDYSSVTDALDGFMVLYETRVKEAHPGAKQVSYDLNSLVQYIDDLKEAVLLIWDNTIHAYKRHNKAWIKSALQDHLIALGRQGQ